VSKFDLYSFLLAFAIGNVIALGLTALIDKSQKTFAKLNHGILVGIGGCFLMQLGLMFFYNALDRGPASLVSPVASVYPVITAVMAYFYLKEKFNKSQLAGIVLATLGVICISI
jgi:drug/metabolite transporter (DMT)-like permease